MRDELATKADIAELLGATKTDIARLEGQIHEDFAKLEGKVNERFIATIATIAFVNKDAIVFLAHILGLVK